MFDGVGASLYTQQVCNVLPMQKAKILRAERLDSKTEVITSFQPTEKPTATYVVKGVKALRQELSRVCANCCRTWYF